MLFAFLSDFVLPSDVREGQPGSECVIALRRVSVSEGSVQWPSSRSAWSIQLIGHRGAVIYTYYQDEPSSHYDASDHTLLRYPSTHLRSSPTC